MKSQQRLAQILTDSREDHRRQLELIRQLKAEHLRNHAGEAELCGRIQSFEWACRMQNEATQLIDFSTDTAV
jgi:hypothetical protein